MKPTMNVNGFEVFKKLPQNEKPTVKQDKEYIAKNHNTRIQKAKPKVDSDEPHCNEAKKLFTGKTTKEKKFLQNNHERNMSSLVSRINDIGNMNDRKKNINDPIAYPPQKFVRGKMKKENAFDFLSSHQSKRVAKAHDVPKFQNEVLVKPNVRVPTQKDESQLLMKSVSQAESIKSNAELEAEIKKDVITQIEVRRLCDDEDIKTLIRSKKNEFPKIKSKFFDDLYMKIIKSIG